MKFAPGPVTCCAKVASDRVPRHRRPVRTNKEEIKIYTDKIKYRHYESEIKSVVDESDELYPISESKKTVANINNDILNLKSDSSINTDIQNRSDKLEEIIWAITLGQSL